MTEEEKYPSELAERFQVRMPEGLRDRIKAASEANGRSMNAEILRVLEKEFPPPLPLSERLMNINALLGALKVGVTKEAVDQMAQEMEQLLGDIAAGRVEVEKETRKRIAERVLVWEGIKARDEWQRRNPPVPGDDDDPF